VLEAAARWLGRPTDTGSPAQRGLSEQTSTFCCDAEEFLEGRGGYGYDVLLVDLFVRSDLSALHQSTTFLYKCSAALSSFGIAAFNLPHRDKEFEGRCREIFGEDRVAAIPCPVSANVVVLALAKGAAPFSKRHVARRAHQLSAQARFPFDLKDLLPVHWCV
jgi:spermidine synthase